MSEEASRAADAKEIVFRNPNQGLGYATILRNIYKVIRIFYVTFFFYFAPFLMMFIMRIGDTNISQNRPAE